METLFCWVPWLMKWLLGWIPHIGRMHCFQRGVKVSGSKTKQLKPGWYCWMPHASNIYIDNIVRKVVELPEQLLTTKDQVRVRTGGLIVYTIEQIHVWMLDNEDPAHGLLNAASRVLRDWTREHTFDELVTHGQAEMDELTMRAADAVATDFGVDVAMLGLTSFARSSALDLHHAGLSAGARAVMVPQGE